MQLVIRPSHPLRAIQLSFFHYTLPSAVRKLPCPTPVLMSCLGWISSRGIRC